jgi:hypothetical protein
MNVRGFGGASIDGLIHEGWAILMPEKVRAGGRMIDVMKIYITQAGREALAKSE